MPSRLPVQDIFAGLLTSIGTAIRYWFHYTLVAFAWLGVVPLTACMFHANRKLCLYVCVCGFALIGREMGQARFPELSGCRGDSNL